MPDNFDKNVARRKPSTAKNRPARPWDVPQPFMVEEHESDDIKNIPSSHDDIQKKETAVKTDNVKDISQSPPVKPGVKSWINHDLQEQSVVSVEKPKVEKQFIPAHIKKDISKKHSDLSDTINIHSNFCKLDNDVSDYLFGNLSPSAQSVYLRLYRQSFGWNRNWAAESLPKLKSSCNLSLQTVRKAIKELEASGCIKKEFSDYHKATVYRVFLPSEIGVANIAPQIINRAKNKNVASARQNIITQNMDDQFNYGHINGAQNPDIETIMPGDVKNLEVSETHSGGQKSAIQSVYFSGTSIYNLLENGGALPKNITKYITDTHLEHARDIIDEFYDSIGFSIVSRAAYRKSLFDFFDMIKSGFSPDDIRYAVRWTFKNSRSRPESFSLIKYTIHDAMNELIQELKEVSGEKELVKKKQEALDKKKEWEENQSSRSITNDDLKMWLNVMEELKTVLNEHSYSAFIEPLKLDSVEGNRVVLSAPPDSVSWVVDHFLGHIQDAYRNQGFNDVIVEIR